MTYNEAIMHRESESKTTSMFHLYPANAIRSYQTIQMEEIFSNCIEEVSNIRSEMNVKTATFKDKL